MKTRIVHSWRTLASALLAATAIALPAADQVLVPFVLPWDDSTPGITDLSGLFDKPAGKAGFIRVGPDAHFYAAEKRIRFMGMNFSFAAGMPAKEDGEKIAARLAKFGVNVVRFHHMDTAAWPNGIRKRDAKDSGLLDPEALERMDYFIAQLKARGIYANINLLVGRPFNAADGLPREIETMDWKDRHVIGFWNSQHVELQKEYARRLLAHVNPYTKLDYASDPAVAFVEINNENGLVHAWLGGDVDQYPAVFTRDLASQWNDWLKQKHGTTEKLRDAWAEGAQPVGGEMLQNAEFAQQMRSWNLEKHGGAAATATPKAGGVVIAVDRPGTESWHVQFNQRGLTLTAGKAYTVSFRARGNAAKPINVTVAQAHSTYANLGFSANAQLTNEWRDFRFVFNASQSDTNARISFGSFGIAGAAVELANISVKPGGVEGLATAEQLGALTRFEKSTFGRRTAAAQRDWMRFLYETEDRYWQAMYRFLKDDLKVKGLVAGTIGGCSPLNIQAKLDWVDTHSYWQHPRFPRKQWDPGDWIVDNKTMVNERGGTLPGLALKRVAGKPHACTEYNHAAPNTFASEGFLLLAAYACLQDWDAIYAYSYAHTRKDAAAWNAQKIPSFFDIDQHPTKMATWVTAAAMFLRGDVAAARAEVKASLPEDREIDLLRTASSWSLVDGAKAGLPRESALLQRVAVSREPVQAAKVSIPEAKFESDTRELMWDVSNSERGVVTVDTARTKGVIGYSAGKRFELGSVTIEPGRNLQEGWSTITVTAKDGGFLVTATGLAENTGMGWKNDEKNTVGRDWGSAPSLVEVITADITFNLPTAKAWALDGRGQRMAEVPVTRANGKSVLNVGPQWKTLWYEVQPK